MSDDEEVPDGKRALERAIEIPAEATRSDVAILAALVSGDPELGSEGGARARGKGAKALGDVGAAAPNLPGPAMVPRSAGWPPPSG